MVNADPDAERPWLATEYIPGPTLREAVVDVGTLDADRLAALGMGLAEGLAAIHAHGLIHRDLKPGNVIMAADGPRIIDFGIARAVDSSTLTGTGTVLGTFGFMPPEQISADAPVPAGDVFALGCVLVFAARGAGPFDASSVLAIMHRVLHEPPDLRGVPDGLREVVAACLAKDPAQRPETGELIARFAALGAATTPLWLDLDGDAGDRSEGTDGTSDGEDPAAPTELQFDPATTYAVASVNSGKVLDVTDLSTEDGVDIQQWVYHGGPNQRWELIPD